MQAMSLYVLRYKGEGPKPVEQVEKIHSLTIAKVVDDSAPRMTLIESEASLDALSELIKTMGLDRWVVREDATVALPDTNYHIKKQPV